MQICCFKNIAELADKEIEYAFYYNTVMIIEFVFFNVNIHIQLVLIIKSHSLFHTKIQYYLIAHTVCELGIKGKVFKQNQPQIITRFGIFLRLHNLIAH